MTIQSLLLLGGRPRKRARGVASLNITVRDLGQLFNCLDPAPFWDRDLDREAAAFIEEEFRDRRSAASWHLHVHVREGAADAADLQAALEHYYGRLANSARRALHEHWWLGQLALAGGTLIFMLSIGIRGALRGAFATVPLAIDQGLILLAWLAFWRPAEAMLYGWIPFYRQRRLFERLAAIRVTVRRDTVEHEPRISAGPSPVPEAKGA